MGRKIVFSVTVSIEVDEEDWADEYGLTPETVWRDVQEHLTEWVPATLKEAPLNYMFDSVVARVPKVRVLA